MWIAVFSYNISFEKQPAYRHPRVLALREGCDMIEWADMTIDGLVEDYSNTIVNALKLLQSTLSHGCTFIL